MSIQWFPGHMAKARRLITEKLKLIDLAIELLDARLPLSSRNPMIDEILVNKPRLVLLNKSDLADPEQTNAWIRYFLEEHDLDALAIDSLSGTAVQEILPRSKKVVAKQIADWRRKGIQARALRALIVGIPNVGKSTLINRLAGRRAAAVGDRPGITKHQQWIKVGQELELLDTPGILWPKFEDQQVGYRLAATGAIKDEVLNAEDIVFYLLKYLIVEYRDLLTERFQVNLEQIIPSLAYETEEIPPHEIVDLMEDIGRKRGCIRSGGVVDLQRASQMILQDLRTGKLGRISLERP